VQIITTTLPLCLTDTTRYWYVWTLVGVLHFPNTWQYLPACRRTKVLDCTCSYKTVPAGCKGQWAVLGQDRVVSCHALALPAHFHELCRYLSRAITCHYELQVTGSSHCLAAPQSGKSPILRVRLPRSYSKWAYCVEGRIGILYYLYLAPFVGRKTYNISAFVLNSSH
jgi:hypothetical protein